MESIFRLMDTDQDGFIPVEEAHRLARMLGVVAPEHHSVHYKGVSLSQFQGWIASLTKPFNHEEEVLYTSKYRRLYARKGFPSNFTLPTVFQAAQFFTFMKDNKGFMTEDRLKGWMKQNGIEFTEAELQDLIEMMNASEDSRGICYDDWSRFYIQAKASR